MKKSPPAYADHAKINYWDRLLGGVLDIVMKIDIDVNITYVNYRIEEYLGPRTNYFSKSFRSLGIAGAEAELWTNTLRRAAVSKKPQMMVFDLETKNKVVHQFETSVSPVLDSEGNTFAFTLIMRDLGNRQNYSLAAEKWKLYKSVVLDLFKNTGGYNLNEYNAFINKALEKVGAFFGLDRVYLFSYNVKVGSASNSHEWCADGISAEIDNLQDLPMAMLPDWINKHMAAQPFVINDVKSLNPNSFTRRTLESQGIKSLITQPIIVNSECIGFIGCDAVKKHRLFGKDDSDFLEIVADVLSGIIQNFHQHGLNPALATSFNNNANAIDTLWTKELEEFAYMSAHNFMSPLANMMGLIENANLKNQNEHAAFLENMKESVYRIKRTFDGMKKVMLANEKPSARFEKLRLSDCFTEMRKLLQTQADQSEIKISTTWDADEVVYCKAHIENIMLNLLNNAIKFRDTSRKSELKINASHTKNGTVVITFTDNGKGLDLKKHSKEIFGLYKRFHPETEGSGVGLYTVKSQLLRNGGKIDVKSKPGVETTFTITLKPG